MSRLRVSRVRKYLTTFYIYTSRIFVYADFNSLYVPGGYGDRNSGGDGMVVQEDTIFVSGMDPSISEEEICEHFGAIGLIKVRLLTSNDNDIQKGVFQLKEGGPPKYFLRSFFWFFYDTFDGLKRGVCYE